HDFVVPPSPTRGEGKNRVFSHRARRNALSLCGRGQHRRRQQTRFGEGLAQRIDCPRRETPHPAAFGCHLLPQGEKGRIVSSLTGAGRNALSPCGRGQHRRRQQNRLGEGLAQRIDCPRRKPPHPAAFGCHLLPQGEKGGRLPSYCTVAP